MSIDEIAGVTRIPVRSLEYLEAGLFEKLPADVFVRGFLRSYARCVGLDAEEAIRRYTRCGMTPAPVSSPLAEELAGSMATLEEREYSSAVRRVTSVPGPPHPESGSATSPAAASQGEVPAASPLASPLAPPPINAKIDAKPEANIDAKGDAHIGDKLAAETMSMGESAASVPVSAQRAPESTQDSHALASGKRRKRRRKRKSRLATERQTSSVQAESRPVGGASHEAVADVAAVSPALATMPVTGAIAGDRPVPATPDGAQPATRPATDGDGAAHDDAVAMGTVLAKADAGIQARTSEGTDTGDTADIGGTGDESAISGSERRDERQARARTSSSPRPVLVIDDERPEDAERIQQERAERADASWRTFLPPALLDSDEGSHRGALTLAVIILVIVATLTMSYLLRRPSGSGDGITQDMVTPPPSSAQVARA